MSAPKLTEQFHATSGICVSTQTIRNRLHKRGLRGRRPYKEIILRTNHARARLNWVTAHRRNTINKWNNVLFNDESRFCVRFSDWIACVWRAKGERVDVTNVQQGDGGLVKAWRGIDKNGKTELVIKKWTRGLPTLKFCERILFYMACLSFKPMTP